jgi:hypothetical protein
LILGEHKVELVLRGARDYIRGADLISEFFNLVPDIETLDVHFRSFCRSNVKLVEVESFEDTRAYPVSIKAKVNDVIRFYSYCNDAVDTKPLGHDLCFESSILPHIEISGSAECHISQLHEYSLMDKLIVANKVLLDHYFEFKKARWIFVQLKLVAIPSDTQLSLRVKRHLGTKLVESEISSADHQYGSIFYSLN